MGLYKHFDKIGHHLQKLACIAFVLTFAAQIQAADGLTDDEHELLKISGMYEALSGINTQFNAGLKDGASRSGLSEEMQNTLASLSNEHLSEENLTAKVNKRVANNLSEQVVEESLEWYRSDLGKKITAAENASNTADSQQKMMAMASELMSNQERVALEQRILDSIDLSESFLSMQQQITLALVESMAIANSGGKPVDLEPIKQQLAANAPAMKAQLDQFLVLSLLYSHRNISIEDLKQYEAFNKSAAGKKFNDVAAEALVEALKSAMADLAAASNSRFR